MFPNTQSPTLTAEQLQALQLIGQLGGLQQKAQTVGAPVGPYLHGPGGLFGVLGLDQPVISTHTQIIESLAASLPVRSASTQPGEGGALNPYASYITGFVRSDEQEKDGVCDDPEEAGNMKTCILTTAFGRKEFKTRQVEIDRIGQTIRRGEFMDQFLVNSPLVNQLGGILTQRFGFPRGRMSFNAANEMVVRIAEIGVAYQRWFCPQVYTGNPANNSAGGGYKEFPGLDLVISTTKVDAISGQSCPSLYSTIQDFNYNDVQNVNAPFSIFRVLKATMRYLTNKAISQNMQPVEWALTMRTGLFDAIVDVWPCEYAADRCMFTNTNAGGNLVMNDFNGVELRDAMRTGRFLLVDGRRIRVITDDCIAEETAADNAAIPVGGYSSDIYVVPLTIRGGRPVTFWEYYDYSQATMPAVTDARANVFFWSDAGRFMWSVKSPDNWCLELISKIEPRLRLMTPQLAARITNAVYIPDFGHHYDDPLPTSEYWVDGGVPTGYPGPSPYSEWNLGGPGGW